jgi:hypothetical protein
MMKRTMMAVAAIPAVLLTGGGVAVAQTAGAPAGPAVVQQTATHHGAGCGQQPTRQAVTVSGRHGGDGTCDGTRQRDRDRVHTAGQPGAQPGSGMMTRAHHGDDHNGRGDG